MNFELTSDQEALREAFARFLDEESSMARVRAALPTGFDRPLWRQLAELGAFSVRVPEAAGGLGLGLVEATSLLEEVGRTLASGPVAEAMLAARLLATDSGGDAAAWLASAVAAEKVVTLALHDIAQQPEQWVAGGAIADAAVGLNGDRLVLVPLGPANGAAEPDLGFTASARVRLDGPAAVTLAHGPQAVTAFGAAIEEWKLLAAAALSGIGREAIRLAAAYARERLQFGQPIGAYQALSHPLADLITEIESGKLLVWQAVRAIADGAPTAAADVSLALWWNAGAAARAGQQAIQTFGGYGLTTEYDIYLYNLRAKALPLPLGDAARLLEEAGERLYGTGTGTIGLPEAGAVPIEFDFGEEAEVYAGQVDAFFRNSLTPELKAKAHFSWDGHDPGLHRKLGQARMLFPAWPEAEGGRGLGPYAVAAGTQAWTSHGWTIFASATTAIIGEVIRRFGSEEVRRDVLSKIVAGDVICSLGFSEPSSGSDVFAAQCRATPDGDGWRIDGTKMFTSGANIASYVLLLARTDPTAAKHKGLTMFIVPLNAEGVTIQPVHTFMDERTNVTFYDAVHIPDSYRLGEVNAGVRVMSAALELEHGSGFSHTQEDMLHAAEDLCRAIVRNGRSLIDDAGARARLARTRANTLAAKMLYYRALWAGVEGKSHPAFGPMSKMFSSERFLSDADDLVDLTAPNSLSRADGPAGKLNLAYRHAHGTRIYGGTSQVHRSLIAERFLGLPRSRAAG